MNQLEIQFFWPLTEQIPLDLDYRPVHEYEAKKQADMLANSVSISTNGTFNGTFAINSSNISSSFVIDIDQVPLTVVSSTKPNVLRKYLYKILGVRWKSKC